MGRLKLFDDGGSSKDSDLSKIEINSEYAKRYEYNKKREDLQRYEELKKQGRIGSSDSDSEESSSEEDEELSKPSKETDSYFFDALIKIKNKDPILWNKDAKLFNSDSENEDEGVDASEKEGKKKKKPMYLKDVVSKHLIEAGPEFNDDEMESNGDGEMKNGVKSYAEEQEELRMEFLEAVKEAEKDDEGDFLRVKNSGDKEEDEDDEEIPGKLDEYFGEDEKLDEDNTFLKDYFRNRMWIDGGGSKEMGNDEIYFSEDGEEFVRQEDYEREYNFRYEENAGERVLGHSRKVEGSVRKKENTRKLQRERKEDRMAQAEFERNEELKRLKNLKKKEINEKLEKIRKVAGIDKEGIAFLDEDDLEEEFDPDEYNRKMNEAFGDVYYDAEDVNPEFQSDQDEVGVGFEKPDFGKEDELLGLPKGWEEAKEPGDGFMSVRQRILKDRVNAGDENNDGEDGDDLSKEGKRKRERKPSEVEKAVREQLMEEYYKLDYEDTVGDLKTRFKYKPVKSKRYGLNAEEILMMDDKDLNQYVSLKKLAPYREEEWQVLRSKTIQLKQGLRKSRNGETSDSNHKDRKEKLANEGSLRTESNVDTSTLSRPSKRRRRQAELKLSRSRLMAYGKMPSKSRSKNK